MDTTTCSVCGAPTDHPTPLERALSHNSDTTPTTTNHTTNTNTIKKYNAIVQSLYRHANTLKLIKFTVEKALSWNLNITKQDLDDLLKYDYIHHDTKNRNKYDTTLNDKNLLPHDVVTFGKRFGRITKGDSIRQAIKQQQETPEQETPQDRVNDPSFLTRIGRHIGRAPVVKKIKEHIRDAMSTAILLSNDSDSSGAAHRLSDMSTELTISDYRGIDRNARASFVEEERDGMKEGLRSIYSPKIFYRLRSSFNITEDDFCAAMLDHPLLTASELHTQQQQQQQQQQQSSSGETKDVASASSSVSSSAGRSGASMFFSADNHFVVKEITKKECTLLLSSLPSYYQYTKDNPNSLLPRYMMLLKVAIGTVSFVLLLSLLLS